MESIRLPPVLAPGEHVLCAVSGGVDSVALLLLLADAQARGDILLSAAHFEHGIRGEASVSDAVFVQALCERLGVTLRMGSACVPEIAKKERKGIEEAARDQRYSFLRRVAREIGADVIALAHHMDDQAETVLMHLFRGSGTHGLRGMPMREGDLVRPLLEMRKEELRQFVLEKGEVWREDATNAIPDSPRNVMRLEILPKISKIYPGCVKAIARYAGIAKEDDEYMQTAANGWMSRNGRKTEFGMILNLEDAPHDAILIRALRMMLPILDSGAARRLADLCRQTKGSLTLTQGYRAERHKNRLYIVRTQFENRDQIIPLRDGAKLDGIGSVSLRPCAAVPERNDLYRQVLSAKALEGAVIRIRRPGDKIHPLGAPGSRLLSDYLTDKKIDRPLRDMLLLVANGREILWVAGVGISENAKILENQAALEIVFIGDKFLP